MASLSTRRAGSHAAVAAGAESPENHAYLDAKKRVTRGDSQQPIGGLTESSQVLSCRGRIILILVDVKVQVESS